MLRSFLRYILRNTALNPSIIGWFMRCNSLFLLSADDAHHYSNDNGNGNDNDQSTTCPAAWRQTDYWLHKSITYFPFFSPLLWRPRTYFPQRSCWKRSWHSIKLKIKNHFLSDAWHLLITFFSVLPKVINTLSRYLGLSGLLLANTKRGREPSYDGTKKHVSFSCHAGVRNGQACHCVTLYLWVTKRLKSIVHSICHTE